MNDVSNPAMLKLAVKVAEAIYEGDPEADLVTREIATAENRREALKRLEALRGEVERAIEIVKKGR